LGATDETLAKYFDVSTVTICAWKLKHPSFLNAIKSGKEDADANVADSLYNRARGYSHTEEKIVYDTNTGQFVRTNTIKQYPPDTAAAFIWLKNRQSKIWRDKQSSSETETQKPIEIYVRIPDNGRGK